MCYTIVTYFDPICMHADDLNSHSHILNKKTVSLTVLICTFGIVFVILRYPPLMLLGLDIIVIAGIILIPIIAGKVWRYEIDRIGKIMHDIEHHMEAFNKLDERQQEEYEQYHILKSTKHSIDTLQESGKLDKVQRQQLTYLKRQHLLNKFRLLKRGFLWTLGSVKGNGPHPSLLRNMQTIFTDSQFQAVRLLIIVWLLFSVIIGYLAFKHQ